MFCIILLLQGSVFSSLTTVRQFDEVLIWGSNTNCLLGKEPEESTRISKLDFEPYPIPEGSRAVLFNATLASQVDFLALTRRYVVVASQTELFQNGVNRDTWNDFPRVPPQSEVCSVDPDITFSCGPNETILDPFPSEGSLHFGVVQRLNETSGFVDIYCTGNSDGSCGVGHRNLLPALTHVTTLPYSNSILPLIRASHFARNAFIVPSDRRLVVSSGQNINGVFGRLDLGVNQYFENELMDLSLPRLENGGTMPFILEFFAGKLAVYVLVRMDDGRERLYGYGNPECLVGRKIRLSDTQTREIGSLTDEFSIGMELVGKQYSSVVDVMSGYVMLVSVAIVEAEDGSTTLMSWGEDTVGGLLGRDFTDDDFFLPRALDDSGIVDELAPEEVFVSICLLSPRVSNYDDAFLVLSSGGRLFGFGHNLGSMFGSNLIPTLMPKLVSIPGFQGVLFIPRGSYRTMYLGRSALSCNGIAEDQVQCGSYGVCLSVDIRRPHTGIGICGCDRWHEGSDCEVLRGTCYGYLPVDACNKHGVCQNDGMCVCESGFSGNECQNPDVELFFPTGQVVGAVLGGGAIILISVVLLVLLVIVILKFRRRTVSQKVSLTKLEQLQDVDLLLEEQRLGNDPMFAHLKINHSLFEIDYDKLEIGRRLGEGGSNAVVFRARWMGKDVAFKCFKLVDLMFVAESTDEKSLLNQQQSRFEEFEKEVAIMGSLNHPHILRWYGATVRPPRVGYVMELCSRGDLSRYLKTEGASGVSLRERIRLILETSLALEFLHGKGIIHRDVKLENVLVDDRLSCKLMDFGCSRLVDDFASSQQLTKTTCIGTSMYMAPEMARGDGQYDEKCDVYSYAILAFVVLTHELSPSFGDDDVTTLIHFRVATDPLFRPVWPQSESGVCVAGDGDRIPSDVQKLIVRCWTDCVELRPSFTEIVSELTRIQNLKLGNDDSSSTELLSETSDDPVVIDSSRRISSEEEKRNSRRTSDEEVVDSLRERIHELERELVVARRRRQTEEQE